MGMVLITLNNYTRIVFVSLVMTSLDNLSHWAKFTDFSKIQTLNL